MEQKVQTNEKPEHWSWWVGHDDERYHTECDSREEAVRIAKEEHDGGYIVEAMKPNIALSGYFDADIFMETADENAWEEHGDPDGDTTIFDVSPDLRNDLQDMVLATIDAWQKKHNLTFTGWQFSASRNEEWIPGPSEDGDV
jgi:hypothetical protein